MNSMKIHLFIERSRDSSVKVIDMTEKTLPSLYPLYTVLPILCFGLVPRAKGSAVIMLFPQEFSSCYSQTLMPPKSPAAVIQLLQILLLGS